MTPGCRDAIGRAIVSTVSAAGDWISDAIARRSHADDEAKRHEEDCEKTYDREIAECRAYAAMTGDKYTFVACKKRAERNLVSTPTEF